MLTQLLTLKKRREGTIRQRIVVCKQRAKEIEQLQQKLEEQRTELWNAWRQANKQQQQVPEGKLYNVQQYLSDFYLRDQAITQQQITLQNELLGVTQQQASQTTLLQRNQISQQKLAYVLDELKE